MWSSLTSPTTRLQCSSYACRMPSSSLSPVVCILTRRSRQRRRKSWGIGFSDAMYNWLVYDVKAVLTRLADADLLCGYMVEGTGELSSRFPTWLQRPKRPRRDVFSAFEQFICLFFANYPIQYLIDNSLWSAFLFFLLFLPMIGILHFELTGLSKSGKFNQGRVCCGTDPLRFAPDHHDHQMLDLLAVPPAQHPLWQTVPRAPSVAAAQSKAQELLLMPLA